MNSWLYLDAYSEITFNHKNKECLICNVLDSKKYYFSGSDYETIKKVYRNEYSIRISEKEEASKFKKIINSFEEYFIGGVIKSENKPLILYPKINIQKDLRKFKKLSHRDQGFNILDCLLEILIIVDCKKELSTNRFTEIIKSVEYGSLLKTNIKIENYISNCQTVNSLMSYFEKNKIGNRIFIHAKLKDFLSFIKEYKYLIGNDRYVLCVEIDKCDFDTDIIKEKNLKFDFIIANEDDFYFFSEIAEKYNLNCNFKVDFVNSEIEFLEKFVFLDKNEIDNLKIDKRSYDANKVLNKNLFGKLVFKHDGVYNSELNCNRIASYSDKMSLKEMIYEALVIRNEWFLTRNKVMPCKSCVYKNVCPPISENERRLKRYNFCTLKN